MNLEVSIRELNTIILEKQPKTFTASWIIEHIPKTYRCICKHARTPLNGRYPFLQTTILHN